MRVLVLGGTAWLGGLVAGTAVAAGHDVACLARGQAGSVPAGARFVAADRDDANAYTALDGSWDLVVDVARHPGHVRGAVRALEPVAARYAFVSTSNVYADHSVPGTDESAPLLPPLPENHLTDTEHYGEAKVACEQSVLEAFGAERSLIARAGLLGGPGDVSGRSGYWPLRFAHPAVDDAGVLVPDIAADRCQLLDARDLAAWLVTTDVSGTFNTTGDTQSFGEFIAASRAATGHTGPVRPASEEWLRAHDVQPWMGERSLPLWLGEPGYAGFAARTNAAARGAGLVSRPLAETLTNTRIWEVEQGIDRPRRAGLTRTEERELIGQLADSSD